MTIGRLKKTFTDKRLEWLDLEMWSDVNTFIEKSSDF